jgi:hypothetical protein
MKFYRHKHTHIRFEPEVDGGTAYAFEYEKGVLVTGRKKMYCLLTALSEKEQDADFLNRNFIGPLSGETNDSYTDEKELMVDLMKLVNADVLRVVSSAAGSCREKHDSERN